MGDDDTMYELSLPDVVGHLGQIYLVASSSTCQYVLYCEMTFSIIHIEVFDFRVYLQVRLI